MEYLIIFIDIDKYERKVFCNSIEELNINESYCLEFDLPYHIYKLNKLY